jgi:hypothetical protein
MNPLFSDFIILKKGQGYGDEDIQKATTIAFGVAAAQTAKELEGKKLPDSWIEFSQSMLDINKVGDFIIGPEWSDLNKAVVNEQGETIPAVFARNLKSFLDQI